MIRQNVNRNKAIYELWEKAYTVKQIAVETGIPRGTVAYYVRKFNRAAEQGKPVVFPESEPVGQRWRGFFSPEFKEMLRVLNKVKALKRLSNLISTEKYQDAYYFLMDIKLMKEIGIADLTNR